MNAHIKNILTFICTVFLLGVAIPAQAEDKGLPQLDTSLFPEQLFWLAVTFGILYLLMAYVALPGVERTQANRKQVIDKELETAKMANQEAKNAIARTEASLNEARAKSQAQIREMIAEVSAEEDLARSNQEKEHLRHIRRIEADIAVTREAAMKHVPEAANDLAANVVNKILSIRK